MPQVEAVDAGGERALPGALHARHSRLGTPFHFISIWFEASFWVGMRWQPPPFVAPARCSCFASPSCLIPLLGCVQDASLENESKFTMKQITPCALVRRSINQQPLGPESLPFPCCERAWCAHERGSTPLDPCLLGSTLLGSVSGLIRHDWRVFLWQLMHDFVMNNNSRVDAVKRK